MGHSAGVPDVAPFPPPGFRRFWTGEAISGFGSYVTLIALQTFVVLDLGGGATETGWLNAARWLPYLAVGLVVGALVDRVRRRPVMVVTDLVRTLLMAAIPLAWLSGILTLPFLLVVVVCFGAASLVNDAASQSFLPRLVPRRDLQRAHAQIDGADAVSQTAGPALGGVLARLLGAPLTIAASALGYLASAIAVATLRTPEPAATGRDRPWRSLGSDIADGVRWVYRESGLRVLAVATHLWFAANATLGVVLAPYALRDLALSPAAFGFATGAAGVGALVGASLTTRIGARIGSGGAITTAHAVSVVGVLMMAAAALAVDNPIGAATALGVGQALHGFAMGLSNSHEMAYRQVLTPDALQARTNTTMRSFNRAVIVVVSPVAGVLAEAAGLVPALLVAAGVFAVVVLVLVLTGFVRERISSEADDDPPS